MQSSAQLTAVGVAFSYGPRVVLDALQLTVGPGDCIGLVGPNGSGKSTLLRLLASELSPAEGSISTRPAGVMVSLMHQQLLDRTGDTVGNYLQRVTGVDAIAASFDRSLQAIADGAPRAADDYDRALAAYVDADVAGFDAAAQSMLDEVRLPSHVLGRLATTLSGGQRTKVGLAATLLSKADVLLLDEPTNDLDAAGMAILERQLVHDDRPTVIVSHDRAFLEAVTTAIFELDPHTHGGTRYNGGFSAWRRERELARQHHQEAFDDYTAKRSELQRRATRQRDWSSQGVRRAKADKSEGDKFIRAHRVESSEKLASKAKKTERALERLERNERVEAPWKPWELRLTFAAAERSGQQVAQLVNATVEREGFVLGPVNATVDAGDRILITGKNGSGKTTLLDALFGTLPVSTGTQRVGPSTTMMTLRQNRQLFAAGATVLRGFVDATGLDDPLARSQLAKLGITANLIDGAVTDLSPGEQTRLAFAAFAAQGANVLVLDEPTNHLDMDAIEQLESAIEVFPHTVLLVSHDRQLIDSVRTNRHWHLDAGQLTEQ